METQREGATIMTLDERLGLDLASPEAASQTRQLIEYINMKLAARGCPIYGKEEDYPFLKLGKSLLASFEEKNRILSDYLCPADQRIQNFLNDYLKDVISPDAIRLPANAFVLERHGLARVLSLPPDRDHFESDIVQSYRVHQGVLHNPQKDRRTTEGVFHVAEEGLPVPADKKAVPKGVFAKLLQHALNPPRELLRLPFTASQERQAEIFVSLLLRPIVCPAVPGVTSEKTLETRFFVPGNLVGNLDFVESIFGNAGDPYLPDNDAQLDVEHWTGHTGCVILATHLIRLKKKELGLPHHDKATERQRRDGMCWKKEDELYNNGQAFKVTCRDKRGVMVTIIADNYFGYCKKEVKTQISYAANLFGLCEEEHAGGAVAFPSYDLGEDFKLSTYYPVVDHTFQELSKNYAPILDLQPEGYAIDKTYPDIIYLPEDAAIKLRDQQITWQRDGQTRSLRLTPYRTYVLPSGYKVEMVKPEGRRWRLIGTTAEGTFCHKPCTVSGGGKSEISKSIADAILGGPVFVADFQKDFQLVEEIIEKDYESRFREEVRHKYRGRKLLSPERSLGSVIKLLTPSPEFTEEYNAWLRSIPRHVKDLVFIVKRFYRPEWGGNWRKLFSVDIINGMPGNELKYKDNTLITQYLRVGFTSEGSWRTFSLRKDFYPAAKLQMEDDISASIVVPRDSVEGLNPDYKAPSQKFLTNCENRFFQRPDDAIHRGYDKKTEADFSRPGNFFSNYAPVTREEARKMVDDTIGFDRFTEPMRRMISEFAAADSPDYIVCSANPRIVDGKPSKNPRYLQTRPDLENPRTKYLCELGLRLYRRIPLDAGVPMPVNAVLPGRRNNPSDPVTGMRPLAVHNPIHFQELPELFMDYISSLTGKSPSTTGAGSEGALTKGPFNALPPIIDLNNALVSYLLTAADCFTTAAGCVGPNYRVDHDISLLVPEIWARMSVEERNSRFLIENGHLERCKDFEHAGKKVLASRLGYRVTESFVRTFFGRVFSNPDAVFTEEMLRPEKQGMDTFADGVDNIVTTQQRVAQLYFDDGSIEVACPPLMALLNIMALGHYQGKDVNHPEIRLMFTREEMLRSDWYQKRLDARQQLDTRHWQRQVDYLNGFLRKKTYEQEARRLKVEERLEQARQRLAHVQTPEHRQSLVGTLGADPAVV